MPSTPQRHVSTHRSAWLLTLACSFLVACGSAGGGNESEETGHATDDSTQAKVCPAHVVEGIDVYDGDGAIDWNAAKQGGIEFAFIKATQGNYNTQTRFATHWANTKAAGVLRGAYHFFDPTVDGAVQAAYFLNVLGDDIGDLPTVVDIECPNGSATCLGGRGAGKEPASVITSRLHQFLDAVEAATGRKPILYSYASYFSDVGINQPYLASYPLWIASLASCATVPSPWKTPTIWQYSFTGKVAGAASQVDRDRFVGTLADLQSFANGTVSAGSGGAGGNSATGTGGNSGTGTGTAGSSATGTGGSAGTGGAPSACAPITFPSGITLETKPNAALSAAYQALAISSCAVPICFLDVTDLRDPSGKTYDVHVNVGAHFELYELVQTEVDPNGTGGVDVAHAYSTSVLLDPTLVAHLDTLRTDEGGPVVLTSGFRSPAHQKAICEEVCGASSCTDSSGAVTCAKNSRHMWGSAADMGLQYEADADKSGFGFVYHENGGTAAHLHVDMRSCD